MEILQKSPAKFGRFLITLKNGQFRAKFEKLLGEMSDFYPFLPKFLTQKVLNLVIFKGGDFWRKISPIWRISIKQSWEHWM